ncbi:hypothetical protein B0H12DRAFT_721831 [Mycena haematopus]|nr:hypothetical protein B0H12DRAFT_721831 [Mycena haematopus]
MAPAMSPLPEWSSMREPTPSDSDEDLVLNDPAVYSTQRKRKNKSKSTSQPKSKRPKTTESSTNSLKRTTDATDVRPRLPSPSWRSAASNGRPPHTSSGSKVKTSRPLMSQPTEKTVSTARTKLVRRTRDEKRRQQSSVSSDEMLPVPTSPRKQSASFPSASAPPARNGALDRDKMRQRFQSGESSRASSSHGPKSAPVKTRVGVEDVIDVSSSPEPNIPRPISNSAEVIVLSSDSEAEEVRKRSAARKTQKRRNAPPNPQDIVEIIDSDDEAAAPVQKNTQPTLMSNRRESFPARSPVTDNEMDLGEHDGRDFGEDLSLPDQTTRSGPDLSEMPADFRPITSLPAIETYRAEKDASRTDECSQPPEQWAPSPSAAKKPIVATPDTAIYNGLLSQSSAISNGPASQRPPCDDLTSRDTVVSPRQRSTFDANEVVGRAVQASVEPDDLSPRSPPRSIPSARKSPRAESSSARHSLPNGLLHRANRSSDQDISQNHDPHGPSRVLASAPASKPQSKPTPLPLPRPILSIQAHHSPGPCPSSSHSPQPASPRKNISDGASGTSVAVLQQTLGLPVQGNAPVLPKLDFSSLPALSPRPPMPLPKKRLPLQESPPRSLLLDPIAVTPVQSTSSLQRGPATPPPLPPQMQKPQSASSDAHLSRLNTLVEAINATGQQNAQPTFASSDSYPPSLFLLLSRYRRTYRRLPQPQPHRPSFSSTRNHPLTSTVLLSPI